MPSNKDLSTEAHELALKLGMTDLVTDGLNNKKLSDLVSDLKAKARDAELDTQADELPDKVRMPDDAPAESDDDAPAPDTPEALALAQEKSDELDKQYAEEKLAKEKADAEAKAKLAREKAAAEIPPYRVAPGKATTSLKGILGPDAEVKAEYFADGQDSIDRLVEKGYVIKK